MNTAAARTVVVQALLDVAPELDVADLRPDDPLRDAANLDGADFLAFASALSTAIATDIPEEDFPRIASLTKATIYVANKVSG